MSLMKENVQRMAFRSFGVSTALATVTLVMLSVVALLSVAKPAQAAFPGNPNGTIIFECSGYAKALGYHTPTEQDICAMNADASNQKRLITNPGQEENPVWSPSFDKIAFVCKGRDGGYDKDICVMNADGSGQRVITDNATNPNNAKDDYDPSWSPDGTKLAFTSNRGGSLRIYKMNADGTNVTVLTKPGVIALQPAWSPDGTKIAFTTYRTYVNGRLTPKKDVYITDADGTNETPLVTDHAAASDAAWSPDGGRLSYTGTSDPGLYGSWYYDIFVINLDGSGKRNLTKGTHFRDGTAVQANAYESAWSPDGKKLVFTARDSNLSIINADGTNRQDLPRCSGEITYGHTTPDWGVGSVTDGRNCGGITGGETPPPGGGASAPEEPTLGFGGSGTSSGTGNVTNDTTPTFSGTAESDSTVRVYDGDTLLGETTADASGNWSLTVGEADKLSDGEHSITATVTDAEGNTSAKSAPLTVIVDTTGPDAPVIESSGSYTKQTFEISGTAEPNTAIELYEDGELKTTIQVDGSGNWSATLTGITEGTHTYKVRAIDPVGNPSPFSEEWTVAVDSTPPETNISSGPSGIVRENSVSFAFGSDEDSVTFECRLIREGQEPGAFESCTSLQSYGPLDDGAYTFEVRATDRSGNTDGSPARQSFEIKLNKPPEVDPGGPYTLKEGGTVVLGATATDPEGDAISYAWDLDGDGTFETEGQNATFSASDLDGPSSHTVLVRVTDTEGASTTAEAIVKIENAAPVISGISAPARALTGTPVVFKGSATDPSTADEAAGLSWRWAIDGGDYTAGSNPFVHTFSSCGEHSISAKAVDKDAGISEPASAGAISVYEGYFRPPLDEGVHNLVRAGSVVPVKVTVGCQNEYLDGLRPEIQLLKGDKTDGSATAADKVETISVSAADTPGIMRPTGNFYIYNLRVPDNAKVGQLFTVRVRPFEDENPGAGLYVVLKVRR